MRDEPYADLSQGVLRVGNRVFERRWRLAGRSLQPISVLDKRRGIEWVDRASLVPGWRHPELMLALDARADVSLETAVDDHDGASAPHLRAELTVRCGEARQVFRFRGWADLPLIVLGVACEGEDGPWGGVEEPEIIDSGVGRYRPSPDRLDAFALSEAQASWEAVALYGRSDHRDNLVQTTRGVAFGKETTRLAGHLLHLTRWDGSAGIAAMKLAPPPDEQIGATDADFALSGGVLSICGGGLTRGDLRAEGGVESYGAAVGVTGGGGDAGARLFRGLMRRLAPPRLPPGGVAFANNWGGGGGTRILSQAFIEQELDAAARLGVTHYQIDAGWHRGDARELHVEQLEPASTSAVCDRFWDVDLARLPDGMRSIAERARSLGVGLGLWYCLDRADDYAHWRRDLATLLELWRSLGVVHFKLDGLSLSSRLGERRVLRLFRELFRESGGAVSASVDITGSRSRRLGVCYGTPHVHDHFVENRYTRNRTYSPHRTLRNLWQLARLVPTYRLEMEWLDTSQNTDVYGDHPLAPARFGTEYALATTLFALPLAWMHVHRLPDEDAAAARNLLRAVLPHQRDILTGEVEPIGEEPSGAAWTGFCSHHAGERGYLLIFREVNDRVKSAMQLPAVRGEARLELESVAGRGRQRRVELTDGWGTFELAAPRSYALYRWRVA